MAKTPKTTTTQRTPKTWAPEIVQARADVKTLLAEAKTKCKAIMASARQSAKVRKLTQDMTEEQRKSLLNSIQNNTGEA